jgi:hypothetical protein
MPGVIDGAWATAAVLNLYGPRIRALQLVWADNRGRFPWEPRWAHGRRHQPVLGRRVEAA